MINQVGIFFFVALYFVYLCTFRTLPNPFLPPTSTVYDYDYNPACHRVLPFLENVYFVPMYLPLVLYYLIDPHLINHPFPLQALGLSDPPRL